MLGVHFEITSATSIVLWRLFRSVLAATLLCASAPVAADVTARYEDGDGSQIVVEVDDRGIARIGGGDRPGYSLFTTEEAFIIENRAGRPTVIRWSDMMAVMDERVEQIWQGLGAPAPDDESQPTSEPAQLFQKSGTAEVAGRSGTRYTIVAEVAASDAEFVISDDPQLAPLGTAWSRFFMRNPTFGRMMTGKPGPISRALAALTDGRGPLQLGGIALTAVSFEDVPRNQFELPTEPLNRAEVRAYLQSCPSERPR